MSGFQPLLLLCLLQNKAMSEKFRHSEFIVLPSAKQVDSSYIICRFDTVPKTCVSSKVLIFVVTLRIKQRTMKLTSEQRSEIISEMASSEAGFNELMRVLLDSFSKQERALFLEEHKGEQGNGFRPRRWRGHGCSFQLRIPRTILSPKRV